MSRLYRQLLLKPRPLPQEPDTSLLLAETGEALLTENGETILVE